MKRWIKAILILPFNVLIVIPCILLYITNYRYNPPSLFQLISGIILLRVGGGLAIWTMVLFKKIGRGTPAPWDPPRHLVTRGPYKFVRNPMITGVVIILIAESLLLSSNVLLYYTILFFIINTFYFKLFEEKALTKKFGTEYTEYKKNVPMWGIKLNRIKLPGFLHKKKTGQKPA